MCVYVCGEQDFKNLSIFLSAVLDVDGGEIEDSTTVPCVTIALLLLNACSKYSRTVQVRSLRILLATTDQHIIHNPCLATIKERKSFNNVVQIEAGALLLCSIFDIGIPQ